MNDYPDEYRQRVQIACLISIGIKILITQQQKPKNLAIQNAKSLLINLIVITNFQSELLSISTTI